MSNKISENVCEEEVFKNLFEQHSKELHDFLYYKFGAEYNPEDVVQDTFSKLWDNCKKVTIDKARSFIFTVANNQMLNVISRRKTVLNYRKHPQITTNPESPQFVLEENEYMDRLQAALENLTEEQRLTFMLNRVEGKKHKEIAEMLGISQKAVEKRIYKALSILRSQLDGIK